MTILATVFAVTFALLAMLHFYWAAGGSWAGRDAVPTAEDGRVVFAPGRAASLTVGAGLAGFSYICLARVALVPDIFPNSGIRWALWAMFVIFAGRTFGDFRYVGVTRRVSGTKFAKLDRLIYTPLCGIMALGLLALALVGNTGSSS